MNNKSKTRRRKPTPHQQATVGSTLVKAMERFAVAVREHHPEIEPCVVVLDTDRIPDWGRVNSGNKAEVQDLNEEPARWRDRRNESEYAEMRLMTAVLNDPAEVVAHHELRQLATLLVHARGQRPFSRQGRYYGKEWRDAALELGLRVKQEEGSGWSLTHMTDALRTKYADAIGDLEQGLVACRLVEDLPTTPEPQNEAGRAEQGETPTDHPSAPAGAQSNTGSTTKEDGGVGRHRRQGGRRSGDSKPTTPKRPKDGGQPRKGDNNAELWLRCDCEGAVSQIKVRAGFMAGPGAKCLGCGSTFRRDPNPSRNLFAEDPEATRAA